MASRSLGTLTLDLIAHIAGFQTGLDKAARIADERSRRINRALGSLKNTIAGVFAGVSFGVLVRGIVHATDEQEKALANLSTALESTGGAVGFTLGQLEDFAKGLQGTTRFSDEAVEELESRLLPFMHITGEQFKRTTELALDFATATGREAADAARILGVALENPEAGMKRLVRAGIVLDDATKKQIKRFQESGDIISAQNVLLDELATRYGGRAAAAADTFGGSLGQLHNAFKDLLEADGGVDDAKESIQGLTEALRDPETVAAAKVLSAGIINALANVGLFFGKLAVGVKEFGESMARTFSGPAFDDVDYLAGRLANLHQQIKAGVGDPEDQQAEIKRIVTLLGYSNDVAEAFDRQIKKAEELKREGAFPQEQIDSYITSVKGLKAAYGDLGTRTTPLVDAAAAAPVTPVVPPPTEKFLDLNDTLEKQIALFGKTGNAAELAYDLQNSLLGEVTEKEGASLLIQARKLDALEANAKAAEEAAKKAKEQADAEQRLRDAFDKQVESYQAIIAGVSELNEVEAIRYEIAKGTFGVLDEGHRKELEALAAEADATKKLQAAKEEGLALYEETRTPLENYVAAQEHILELYNEQIIDAEVLTRKAADLAEEYKKQTEEVNKFAEEATRNVQDILGNFLADLVNTGKFSFNSLLKSFQEMIVQMIAQAYAAKITSALFGAAGVGSGGGFLAALGLETGGVLPKGRTAMVGEGGWEMAFGGGRAALVGLGGQHLLSAGDSAMRIVNHDESEALFRRLRLPFELPSRDRGGRGFAGSPVLIGSGAQPELFIPDSAGRFEPNADMGNTTMVNNFNFNVQAPEGRVSRATEQQIASAAARGIADASRRNN